LKSYLKSNNSSFIDKPLKIKQNMISFFEQEQGGFKKKQKTHLIKILIL